MTGTGETAEEFMARALRLARKGLGRTSPNPVVGAVIVKGSKVIGSGWHRRAGEPHAEVLALDEAGRRARGADLYVTLEPCCHHGRTPPCTEAIIEAGVKRVFVAATDPNPKVKGGGIKALRKAGIEVSSGILEEKALALNEVYVKYITTGRPFVTLKLATTLDGRIALGSGKSRWITGEKSRSRVHRMRAASDAVMVGIGTVLADDPELTVRNEKKGEKGGVVKGRTPLKVIVDSALRMPLSARVFKGAEGGGVLIYTTAAADGRKIKWVRRTGADVVVVPMSKDGVDLRWVMDDLGRKEVTSVLAEGGSRLAAALVRGRIADKAALFLAPSFFGGDATASLSSLGLKTIGKSPRLTRVTTKKVGEDILVEGYF